MNKQIFVFILLFIALSSAFNFRETFGISKAASGYVPNANCNVNVTGCAELKASCQGPSNSSNPNSCYNSGNGQINGSCCAENLWCVSGTCERNNYGSSCTGNNTTPCLWDFDGTLWTVCQNSQCVQLYGAGDTCTNNTSCIGNLICSNTSNTCVGLGLGAVCNSEYNSARVSQCAAPNYCASNGTAYVCTAPSTTTCNNANVTCNQVNVCNNGNCVGIGSVSAGGASNNQFACADGLSFNGSYCITSLGSGLVSCTATSDCTQYNYNMSLNGGQKTVISNCSCYPQSGNSYCQVNNSYSTVYTSQLNTLATCLNANNCSYNGVFAAISGYPVFNANSAPNSCSYVNCWSAYKKFAGESCSNNDDQYGSCFYSPECGGFPVWAIVVIVIVAVILVLAVVVVIFLVLRRRKDYASI